MKKLNGIIFLDKNMNVDFIDFCYDNINCNSIITEASADKDIVEVVCYATSPKFNNELQKVFNTRYKNKGYCIMQGISTMEASGID